MSRHGMVPPDAPRRGLPWADKGGGRPLRHLRLLANILAREAAAGTALWGASTLAPPLDLASALAVACAVVMGTRWFGLSPGHDWRGTLQEALFLFIGAECFASLLVRAMERGLLRGAITIPAG